jgi:hypothetical protein
MQSEGPAIPLPFYISNPNPQATASLLYLASANYDAIELLAYLRSGWPLALYLEERES